eukprot:2425138-Pleurochrysis_carterae.AAC.1
MPGCFVQMMWFMPSSIACNISSGMRIFALNINIWICMYTVSILLAMGTTPTCQPRTALRWLTTLRGLCQRARQTETGKKDLSAFVSVHKRTHHGTNSGQTGVPVMSAELNS